MNHESAQFDKSAGRGIVDKIFSPIYRRSRLFR